jgi:DNA-binding transcriptional MocR family regulator
MKKRVSRTGPGAPPGLKRLWWAREASIKKDDGKQSSQAHHVLLLLAAYADREGASFPSVATLSGRSGLSQNSVRKALSQLKSTGLVRVAERRLPNGGSDSNLYVLVVDPPPAPGDGSPLRRVKTGTAPGAAKERHSKKVITKRDKEEPEGSKKRPRKRGQPEGAQR